MRSYFGKILLILAVVLGTGLWLLWPSRSPDAMYRTEPVTRGTIAQSVSANGTLNPVTIVNVGTQVSGKISNIYVKVNDEVKEGQLLAEVDPALPQAQLKQSKANLESAQAVFEQAQRDLERTRALVAKDYVAKVDLERARQTFISARNSYESAKAQVERDETNLSYTRIESPINGIVISQDVSSGQTVQASFQTPNMFRIAGNLTDMKIDVSLPEADIGKVKVGMAVTFTVDAFPEREFTGVVDTVNLNPVMQQNVVTYTVTVSVKNEDRILLPGMTAYVAITLSEKKDVLRIPVAALRFVPQKEAPNSLQRLFAPPERSNRDRGFFMPVPGMRPASDQTIYLLKDSGPEAIQVKTGSTDDTYIEVSGDGLKEGDLVITGMQKGKRSD